MVVAIMPTATSKVPTLINAALGLWLIVSPFALRFGEAVAFWTNIVLGALLVMWSLFSAHGRKLA